MQIRVGISDNDLLTRTHSSITLRAPQLVIESGSEKITTSGLSARARDDTLLIKPDNQPEKSFSGPVKVSGSRTIELTSLKRDHRIPTYVGSFELVAVKDRVRLILKSDLEDYIKGVLQSEIPASYHIEAIKAQAVAARTYGLNPRISHEAESFNVCDSFLCCQYFAGIATISSAHKRAIEETRGQILVFQDKPILALFSSNSGGHTENYENCFSDPVSGAFPPTALPYLKGVPEGKLPSKFPSEAGLLELWNSKKPDTVDAWSPHFRWIQSLKANDLEAHMHHEIDLLRKDKQFTPFITPPASGKFGHIKGFEAMKRGVSGVIIALKICTSAGDWLVRKELTIRSIFKNPELKLARLKSARFVMAQSRDRLGLLSALEIRGLGWGHGVGMQQTGAQGHALRGRTYRQILSHYFRDTQIQQV